MADEQAGPFILAYRKDHTPNLVAVKERALFEVERLAQVPSLRHDNVAALHHIYYCDGVAFFLYEEFKLTLLDIQKAPGLLITETEIAAILSQVSLPRSEQSQVAKTCLRFRS